MIEDNHYQRVREQLQARPERWLITGAAGFIGSNLVLALLQLGQSVTGIDNFLTGRRENLTQVAALAGAENWRNFRLLEGDIRIPSFCLAACRDADYVLHQAALGSVTRSLHEPQTCFQINVSGFINMLEAIRQTQVKKLVYASSSATYGDHAELPKRETASGNALSPYALSKQIDEQYARLYQRCYGLRSIGLRYFNVYGPRQDPSGAYAAVIPCFIEALRQGQAPIIFGDGETSRDFCFVENVVQANLLAAVCERADACDQIYNIAVGQRTPLRELHSLLAELLASHTARAIPLQAQFRDFRAGDVKHSHADISKAAQLLGYQPTHDLRRGLQQTVNWYLSNRQAA
ncbi:NAD-dependent epimerase/dehydratase family protein [Pseudoduganella sp. CY13W]|uniref:NAD-dependent epimerase/dehydratase family protein n=2 Tax=Duganella qianjiadongensis TaxID=2692176 RepID=A0ABW9VMN4_9BURK|nr:NAD-dependent epimerase/dehydratase family protein [Duganella qianjiadongensis]